MAMGMTYEQYWYGDPHMVRAYYAAEKMRQRRVNEEAWLHGAYVYRALDATVGNMMRKKGTQAVQYPSTPISLDGDTQEAPNTERQEEQESVYAMAYMTNMVLAGKKWGQKK